jgi:ribosomal protein S18 acetylase RimI-like enzyme
VQIDTAMTAETNGSSKPETVIRAATADDADAVSAVGGAAFIVGHACALDDAHAYIDKHFTPEAMRVAIAAPKSVWRVAESPPGNVVAVACLSLKDADSESYPGLAHLSSTQLVELQRVYAHPSCHGTGVARALVEATLETARGMGYAHAWLGVWERNPRAAAFYSKLGFRHVGEKKEWVGTDHHTDLILLAEL